MQVNSSLSGILAKVWDKSSSWLMLGLGVCWSCWLSVFERALILELLFDNSDMFEALDDFLDNMLNSEPDRILACLEFLVIMFGLGVGMTCASFLGV